MEEMKIQKDRVEELLDKRFVRVYDLKYAEGKHYYDVTRRRREELVAVMPEERFRSMTADAVSCCVVLRIAGRKPVLLLSYEYRYPLGRYVLGIPAGLIDEEDRAQPVPALSAAAREIREETGITVKPGDSLKLISPLVFSTPGMTDESNALVCAVIDLEDETELNQKGAVDGEMFDGFCLADRETALKLLSDGRDEHGRFYSVYTWCALMWFTTGCWEKGDRTE